MNCPSVCLRRRWSAAYRRRGPCPWPRDCDRARGGCCSSVRACISAHWRADRSRRHHRGRDFNDCADGVFGRVGAAREIVIEELEPLRDRTLPRSNCNWCRWSRSRRRPWFALPSAPRREAGDISAGVFDLQGNTLAQAVTGPGHINTMARSVVHFLEGIPCGPNERGRRLHHQRSVEGYGPLHRPGRGVTDLHGWSYRRAVRLHNASGGHGWWSADNRRQIYHEGLFIPLLRCARCEMNEDLLAMIRANVREPVQATGDVYVSIA